MTCPKPSPLWGGPSRSAAEVRLLAQQARGGGTGASFSERRADTPTRLGLAAESALPAGLLAQPAWGREGAALRP